MNAALHFPRDSLLATSASLSLIPTPASISTDVPQVTPFRLSSAFRMLAALASQSLCWRAALPRTGMPIAAEIVRERVAFGTELHAGEGSHQDELEAGHAPTMRRAAPHGRSSAPNQQAPGTRQAWTSLRR